MNCMLGSANRHAAVFEQPDLFDINRGDVGKHLAFATGQHTRLGSHLARAEARIAVGALMTRLPNLRVDLGATDAPSSFEFRQPARLTLAWGP